MITRRQIVVAMGAGALAPFTSFAQQPTAIPTVGVLGADAGDRMANLRAGLRALGYVEGRNIRLLERAVGERYENMAEIINEYARLKVDVIVTMGSTATEAAAKATSTIPVIMVSGFDPVKAKLAASLARPGGNVTGVSVILQELTAKRLQLTKELLPGLRHVGVLWNPDSRASANSLPIAQAAAKVLNLQLHLVEAREPGEFDKAFEALAKARVNAFLLLTSSLFQTNRKRLLDSALKHRLAAIGSFPAWGDMGALIAYGPNEGESYRRIATYVDKILKGVKPGDIPIEQPTTFDFVVNLKTAKALGIKVPQTILLQATRVIE